MIQSCKDIDLTDWHTLEPWVYECIIRHKSRHDFRGLVCSIGKMKAEDYYVALQNHDNAAFVRPVCNIAKEAARRIRKRNLRLKPVVYRMKYDQSSGKTRRIGSESAMQQVFDYIAVYAAEPIWKRRIVPQQVSSIQGRGQIVGVKMIQDWTSKDEQSARWAKAHGVKYTRQCKHIVKGVDIQKCFPSMRLERFIKLFSRDCGNATLVWLWTELLSSHRTPDYDGLMIGALPSQWAAQYMMSYVYRFAMNLCKHRRGRRIKLVSKMLVYMDDLFLTGSARNSLKMAMKKIIEYTYDVLGLVVKPNWHIQEWALTPTDMMGYLVRKDGSVTIRPRVYIRIRRQALRFLRTHHLTIGQARRVCSYKGYVKPSKKRKIKLNLCVRKICRKLKLEELFAAARKAVSLYERRKNHASVLYRQTRSGYVYAPA